MINYDNVKTPFKYGLMFSESPAVMPRTEWYETEEARDEVIAQIKETGRIQTDFHACFDGRSINVHSFAIIHMHDAYRKVT